MKLLIVIFIFLSSCTTNKVINNHGISLIENKSEELIIDKTNKNDVSDILGPPSSVSSFDENVLIFIERKKSSTNIFKLGKRKTIKNNVLVLMFDDRGILKKKDLYDLNDTNSIEFSKSITTAGYSKNSYIYNVLTSLRQKINAPVSRKKRQQN
tara:strand:- start:83 stop:544 length:462 start_codon:yes stop_codon:yes gene_type:complete